MEMFKLLCDQKDRYTWYSADIPNVSKIYLIPNLQRKYLFLKDLFLLFSNVFVLHRDLHYETFFFFQFSAMKAVFDCSRFVIRLTDVVFLFLPQSSS